jgi:50S ribosomal protein L16 3-hydroxylase
VTIIREWLGDLELSRFLGSHLGKAPLARIGTALSGVSAYDWEHLDSVLARGPEMWVVAAGQLVVHPEPRSYRQLRRLFGRGAGIVVKHPERHDARFLELSAAFAEDLPGEQRILVFATPEATNGFGWHYDAEDVFVVQVAGVKDYYFRANTIDLNPKAGAQPDFSQFARETSPLMHCQLIAGDVLYLPRGMWHVARARQDSLSISIGVFPALPASAEAGEGT